MGNESHNAVKYSEEFRKWSEVLGCGDPESAMLTLASSLRNELLASRRSRKGLPVLADELAGLRGIIEFRVRNIDHTAALVIMKNGFACVLSTGESRGVRRNFAVAHEIGHTEFFDISCWPPKPVLQLDLMNSRAAERLCNIFAGALLIPEEQLDSIVQALQRDLSFTRIDYLAESFHVSREVLIRRLAESKRFSCEQECIAVLKRLQIPNAAVYTVETIIPPIGSRFLLGERTFPIGRDAAVVQALLDDKETICHFEIKEYGSPHTGYALAIGMIEFTDP